MQKYFLFAYYFERLSVKIFSRFLEYLNLIQKHIFWREMCWKKNLTLYRIVYVLLIKDNTNFSMTFETFLLVNFNFIFNEIESYASGPCTQNDCIPSKTSRLQAIPFDPYPRVNRNFRISGTFFKIKPPVPLSKDSLLFIKGKNRRNKIWATKIWGAGGIRTLTTKKTYFLYVFPNLVVCVAQFPPLGEYSVSHSPTISVSITVSLDKFWDIYKIQKLWNIWIKYCSVNLI